MRAREEHIRLKVYGHDGVEPVHAEPLGGRTYRILHSPGFVEGIAAGDEVELLDDEGGFKVIKRGGNIAVQVFSTDPIAPHAATLAERVQSELSGWLDGSIERGMVFTIPYTAGFPAIEAFFESIVAELGAGLEWSYGNVYDPETGEPLEWWDHLPA